MILYRKMIALGIVLLLITTIFPVWHRDNLVSNLELTTSSEEPNTKAEIMYSLPQTRGPRLGKVACVRTACEISDEGMKTAKAMLERAWTENITEADVVRAIDQRMVELGSSSMIDAFGLLVVSGNDSGEPGGHGTGVDDDEINQILPGEVVIIDIGARYNGYVSDITRTFFMGEPTAEQRKVYGIIQAAQDAAKSVVQHGVQAKEVDQKARKVIEDAGYGEFFSHAVGHGIGLYIHTFPPVSSSSEVTLSKARDDIITIEPGVYIPDDFGIRIEDDFTVEWFGYEQITFYPRDIENMIVNPPVEEPPMKKKSTDSGGILGIDSGTMGVLAGIIVIALVALFIIIRSRAKEREKNDY